MQPHEGQPVLTAGAPIGQSRAAVILVHGRNASAEDILQLAPHLDPACSYLAPEAANHTWYPFSFLAPTSDNEPGLSSALAVLDSLVHRLVDRGYATDRIVLLGFSQGACLCAEFAVRHARRYGGVVALSGGLIGPPGTDWTYPGSLEATPVFLGCSDVDPHIPRERVDETDAVFERMGASVTKRLYAGMGHTISEDEISVVRTMLTRVSARVP